MDVDDIPPGADFAAHIGAKVGSCDALIAVIGRNWLTARNDAGQLRLSDPNDYVSLEIALALAAGRSGDSRFGRRRCAYRRRKELRDDLRALPERNALTLSDGGISTRHRKLGFRARKVAGFAQANRPRDEAKAALRKRLLRRLIWKVPLILAPVSFAVWWQWKVNQGSRPPPIGKVYRARLRLPSPARGRAKSNTVGATNM